MIYLVIKVAFYLLLAALLGGLAGWIIRNLSAVADKRKASLRWNEQIARIEKERDRLQARINESEDELSSMLREQAELANEHRELVHLNKQSAEMIDNLQHALQRDQGDSDERVDTLRTRALQAESEVALLRQELQRSAVTPDITASQQAHLARLHQQISELQARLDGSHSELERIRELRQKDRENHDKTLQDLNHFLTTANDKNRQLQQQLQAHEAVAADAGELDGLKQIIDMQQADLRKREHRLLELQQQLSESEQHTVQLQSQLGLLSTATQEREQLRARLGQVEACVTELERALEESAADFLAQQQQLTQLRLELGEASEERQSLAADIEHITTLHQQVSEQNTTYRKRILELKQSLQQARAEAAQSEAAVQPSRFVSQPLPAKVVAQPDHSASAMNETIAQLTTSLADMQLDRRNMLQQFLQIQEQYNKRELLIESLQIRLAQAEHLDDDDRRTLADIRRDQLLQGQALTSEIRELRQRLSDAIVERDAYQSQLQQRPDSTRPLLVPSDHYIVAGNDNHQDVSGVKASDFSQLRALKTEVSRLKRQQQGLRQRLRQGIRTSAASRAKSRRAANRSRQLQFRQPKIRPVAEQPLLPPQPPVDAVAPAPESFVGMQTPSVPDGGYVVQNNPYFSSQPDLGAGNSSQQSWNNYSNYGSGSGDYPY